MAGLRGLPSVAMIVGGLQEEGTREKPFIEVSVFQSMGKERKKRRREEVGMKEWGGKEGGRQRKAWGRPGKTGLQANSARQ